MALFGGGKSKSKSSTVTNQADNRIVADRSTVATAGATINNAGADKIAALNSELLGHIAETQGDAVKTIAKLAGDSAAGAADLYTRSGSNVTKSLDGLLTLTDKITGKLIDSAAAQGDGARALAQTAIGAYQPPDAKQGETIQRLGYAAAAVVAGLFLLRK